jgi:hypothetical protein
MTQETKDKIDKLTQIASDEKATAIQKRQAEQLIKQLIADEEQDVTG